MLRALCITSALLLLTSAAHAAVFISPQHPESLQQAINEAIQARATKLVIPSGTYEVPAGLPPEKVYNFHLRVTAAHDMEIDATGVTLIFPKRSQGTIAFIDCHNVTFRGATLRRKTSPICQGVIEAMREGGKSIDVRIDKGYPTDLLDRNVWDTFWASVFTMDRSRWLAHYRADTPPHIKQLEPDLFRIAMPWGEPQLGIKLQPGQPIAWRSAVVDDLHIRNCGQMNFVGVTVAGGSGMCYHEYGGEGGNHYQDCKVTYGDIPEGGTQKPLWASSADGFHTSDARHGPIIENCLFEGMDDDGIAVHGTYACVVQSAGTHVTLWRLPDTQGHPYGRTGDSLRFIDLTGAPHGECKMVSSREVPGYRPPAGYSPDPLYRLFADVREGSFVEATLDNPVPAGANWLVCDANEIGSGYVIRNTTVRKNSARGIMVKGSNGLIENCTLELNARAGIEMMPEQMLWPEADYTRDTIIRNNTLRDVSLNRQEGLLRHVGSIAIYGYREQGGYIAGAGHRNILIENNTFDHDDGPNILITSADKITVRGNKFVDPMQKPSTFGTEKGIDPTALIDLTQCSHIKLVGNTVSDPGPGLKQFVSASGSASGTGFATGVAAETAAGSPSASR